jgi:SAM-dependent methyltransferase
MHAEAWNYLEIESRKLQAGLRVLEFGSHDVNGSPRSLFMNCTEYVGVDIWAGAGVDWVGRAQDFDGEGRFDVVISVEAMEHDPDARGQIASAWRALKPGGVLIITAAAEPREPHRCNGSLGDMGGEHYANIDPDTLRKWLAGWSNVEVLHDKSHGDVYAHAVKGH